VKFSKLILATLVIFAAGFVTGFMLSRSNSTQQIAQPKFVEQPVSPPDPVIVQERFLRRMKQELSLTPEQTNRLEKIFAESRERMRILMDLIEPEWRGELRDVREKIVAELNPEQRQKFDQMLKHPYGDMRRRGDRRTNSPARGATNAL
jgi:Spy/CpxP family protein refolding chaperone